jgi:hypothetical protein
MTYPGKEVWLCLHFLILVVPEGPPQSCQLKAKVLCCLQGQNSSRKEQEAVAVPGVCAMAGGAPVLLEVCFGVSCVPIYCTLLLLLSRKQWDSIQSSTWPKHTTAGRAATG